MINCVNLIYFYFSEQTFPYGELVTDTNGRVRKKAVFEKDDNEMSDIEDDSDDDNSDDDSDDENSDSDEIDDDNVMINKRDKSVRALSSLIIHNYPLSI